jgi:hypothetical protein
MMCPSKTVIAPRGSDAGLSSVSSNRSAIRTQRAVFSFGGVLFTIVPNWAIVSGAFAFVDPFSRVSASSNETAQRAANELLSAMRNNLRIGSERVRAFSVSQVCQFGGAFGAWPDSRMTPAGKKQLTSYKRWPRLGVPIYSAPLCQAAFNTGIF